MSQITASIIIPAFGRLEPLKYTLRSAAAAVRALGEPAEIILVDDGSFPPLADMLSGFDPLHAIKILRQDNAGSIVARNTGLAASVGEFVQFLDSDDLIHPDKLACQIAAMRTHAADISYSDTANASLGSDYSVRRFQPKTALHRTADSIELLLRVQPAPHSPVFRRDYLQKALAAPTVAPSRAMDPAGDVWLYYNLSVHTAKICKVDVAFTATGPHENTRYSHHWERLGFAALLIMEAFAHNCPDVPSTEPARRTVGACAFSSWRALPHGYHHGIEERTLSVWRRLPRPPLSLLGGPLFRRCAGLFGPELAGRIFRLRRHSYNSCRTLSDDELDSLVGTS